MGSSTLAGLCLIWPVSDLVKALVCERYGLVRWRLSLAPAEALTQSVSWAHRLIDDWAQARVEHIGWRSALLWLDQARRARLIALGGDEIKDSALSDFRCPVSKAGGSLLALSCGIVENGT